MKFRGRVVNPAGQNEEWSVEGMSVGELIETLKEYPKDAMVLNWYSLPTINGIKRFETATEKNQEVLENFEGSAL